MKLAILCGANPRAHKFENGATIRVHAGKWRVKLEGVVDSVLALQFFQPFTHQEVVDGQEFEFLDGVNIRSKFATVGTEDYVSAYLEAI